MKDWVLKDWVLKNGRLNIWIDLRSLSKAPWTDHDKKYWCIDKQPKRGFENRRFWFHLWLSKGHEGRGPYLTIGLWFIRIMRGY